MKFIIKLCISSLAVMLTAYLLPGVEIANDNFLTAVIVAAVLAFLNSILKPVMVLLTIPVTVFTLGLFLVVINAVIILLADKLVDGFYVSGFWSALAFSLVLSLVTSVFESIRSQDQRRADP
ncbi:MAG: phage holin family protein [Bacteroidia bacterium]|nr:phage holin family protein [Bacteroidia bacterium]